MATRAEQFAAKTKKAKDDVEQKQKELRALTTERRAQVGALADAAGLLSWDDDVLRGLFGLLATLATSPSPVEDLATRMASAAPSIPRRNGHLAARTGEPALVAAGSEVTE
jgi:hypothetical protein